MSGEYDVIVVGGGHAGCEAAAAAARMGSRVLLITMGMTTIAQMSCNPAMGGIAKGQIVREIDALGGFSGIVTDRTMIQFRMLNRSKGPAMWSPRAQSDRALFSREWRHVLESIPTLFFREDMVTGLVCTDHQVKGVTTQMGQTIYSRAVILTNGTFLNGVIHIGESHWEGGRIGERAVRCLTENLVSLGFETDRMKTGTPVRLDGRTIDYSKLEEQKGDDVPGRFSFTDTPPLNRQRSCYLAWTNEKVHAVLRTGFDRSPLFVGRIKGIGPRYCPSIEDKIERFSDKLSHQLFVEPEGWDTVEVYLNGFSSSLPEDVQYNALRLIEGFENVKIFRPGYAIEYDYFPPVQLQGSLETKRIRHLFFAGQINGTTGYEEAAAQGIMAGINAHLRINGQSECILKRSEAYIGVLIDDLITKGVDEPYRMFTSRAEYRILLRQDNADQRLTPLAFRLGLAGPDRMQRLEQKTGNIGRLRKFLFTSSVAPDEVNAYLALGNSAPLDQSVKMASLLLRPQVSIQGLQSCLPSLREFVQKMGSCGPEVMEETEIMIKYEGYISREEEMAYHLSKVDDIFLKDTIDYHSINALSFEAREKLNKIRPRTIGQASRIPGVSPADISVLLVFLRR
ncbi:MAG: tRNA uridine-5-carboxymethylaminomethyl(34) synthesis enzyme MnmG [Bacteroidales bacterium]|nr:tRNA uridine-5-carboxymethylaminomethyl(34) synthesis enzyme MnmG [Bacteroidales bacterium]